MESIIDSEMQARSSKNEVVYGGFWIRSGALFIDGLIMSLPLFSITYFNVTQWKSSLVMILIGLIGAAYKPFLEYTYGATFGKMACKLKVVNIQFEKPDLSEIFCRISKCYRIHGIFNIDPANTGCNLD